MPYHTFYALKQLGVAALYALLLYAGELYFKDRAIVGYFEPASGLALAVLLIGGKRYAWGVCIGALLVNATSANSLWASATIVFGDTFQAFCGAWLLTRKGKFDVRLESLHDYLRLLLLGGCLSIAIGALAVNTVLLYSGLLASEDYFYSLIQWWMGDTLGAILIAPLIMLWWEPGKNQRRTEEMAEAALMLGLTILACHIIFLDWGHDAIGHVAKGYWMFLIISWVAIRIGSCGTVIVLLITAVYALQGATHGSGYFADDIAQTQLVNYWLYMVILSIVGMALATHFAEHKQAEASLRESKASMKAILDNSPYLSWLKDIEGRYVRVNNAYVDCTGLGNIRQIIGKTDFDLWPKEMAEKYRADDTETIATRQQKHIEELSFDGNKEHWVETFKTPVIDENGNLLGTVGFSRDITERKKAEEQTNKLAFYDTLTQLPNRRILNDRLRQVMAASKRSDRYAALMFLDLDNFKPLNDTHGHDVGDLLLIQASHRIVSCVREVDTVARFGGDEFVVILNELDMDKADSAIHAGIAAEKIRVFLSEPYLLACKQEGDTTITVEHHCTSSIGIVLFIGHETSAEDILKRADMAMYQAKKDGRNLVSFVK